MNILERIRLTLICYYFVKLLIPVYVLYKLYIIYIYTYTYIEIHINTYLEFMS